MAARSPRCPGVPGGSKMDVFIRHARLYYTCGCQGTYLALSTTPLLAPGACDVATSQGGRPATEGGFTFTHYRSIRRFQTETSLTDLFEGDTRREPDGVTGTPQCV